MEMERAGFGKPPTLDSFPGASLGTVCDEEMGGSGAQQPNTQICTRMHANTHMLVLSVTHLYMQTHREGRDRASEQKVIGSKAGVSRLLYTPSAMQMPETRQTKSERRKIVSLLLLFYQFISN